MPELPEVETLRRELARAIVGKKITGGKILSAKTTKPLPPTAFLKRLRNKSILSISRRAKLLILELSQKLYLVIHLKLTGQLIYQPKRGQLRLGGHPQPGGTDNLPNKFTRALLEFGDGSKLFFNDLRKFGWMRIATREELPSLLDHFGQEPLSKEFNFDHFNQLLKRCQKRKMKQLLMDQTLIAGLGNIYADEVCFAAKILPTRLAKNITPQESARLFRVIIKILRLAIKHKGTSANTYVQLGGSPGGFVPYLKVYGRKGEKCKRCGGEIKKIKLLGRGTHFCPKCQR